MESLKIKEVPTHKDNAHYHALICFENVPTMLKEQEFDRKLKKACGNTVYIQHEYLLKNDIYNFNACVKKVTQNFDTVQDTTAFQVHRDQDAYAGRILALSWCNKQKNYRPLVTIEKSKATHKIVAPTLSI